jgi:putative addiction module component (TIGR02574 family)
MRNRSGEEEEMNAEVESVLHVALALPAQSRAVVADRLLESLDQPDRAAVATAWAEQAEERLADYRAGKLAAIPADEVFRSISRPTQP